uniref:Secreted protein n=1 Tax=Panagrellus redivivus TaxID=6233 RepID=A0A7E4UR54_PANRE
MLKSVLLLSLLAVIVVSNEAVTDYYDYGHKDYGPSIYGLEEINEPNKHPRSIKRVLNGNQKKLTTAGEPSEIVNETF